MICSYVHMFVCVCVWEGVFVRACAGMPPLERWPFSGEQTRHLSKVLHHLREDCGNVLCQVIFYCYFQPLCDSQDPNSVA